MFYGIGSGTFWPTEKSATGKKKSAAVKSILRLFLRNLMLPFSRQLRHTKYFVLLRAVALI
jgi:hypothetical protein